jgi:hypothetical protein
MITNESLLEDHRGTKIEIGQTVAYNWSGEIAIGKIVAIKECKKPNWRGEKQYIFHVQGIVPHTDVSKVRSSKNLMVINEK